MQFAIIVFDGARHTDNEQTYTLGPFPSMDSAQGYADAHLKFFHIVKQRSQGGTSSGYHKGELES